MIQFVMQTQMTSILTGFKVLGCAVFGWGLAFFAQTTHINEATHFSLPITIGIAGAVGAAGMWIGSIQAKLRAEIKELRREIRALPCRPSGKCPEEKDDE